MKIFLDANVLFSAANHTRNICRLIQRLAASHELFSSEYARQADG
jgi:hypothetical protein